MSGTHVSKAEQLLAGEHWAILRFKTIHIPGDLRSQQAPGHGYPEHDEDVVSYQVFTDEAAFTAEMERIGRLDYYRDRTIGIHVDRQYRFTTVVSVVKG